MVVRINQVAIPAVMATCAIALGASIFAPKAIASSTKESSSTEKMIAVGNSIAASQNSITKYSYDSVMYEAGLGVLRQIFGTDDGNALTTWCPYGGTWKFKTSLESDSTSQSVVWVCCDEEDTILAIAYGTWDNSELTMSFERIQYLTTVNPYVEDAIEGEFDANPS